MVIRAKPPLRRCFTGGGFMTLYCSKNTGYKVIHALKKFGGELEIPVYQARFDILNFKTIRSGT